MKRKLILKVKRDIEYEKKRIEIARANIKTYEHKLKTLLNRLEILEAEK